MKSFEERNTIEKLRVALVLDWLDTYGGAERIVKYLNEIYDFEEVYTIANTMEDTYLLQMFKKDIKIHTSILQIFGKHFRKLLFLFPFAIKRINMENDFDLIISSSHSIAKGINSNNTLHISYFQARNMKYIWEEKDLYFKGVFKIFKIFIPYLRRQDVLLANNPDNIICNSKFVSSWVLDKYKIKDSPVIYPPIDIDKFALQEEKENYYVTVGRLEPYKRFDVVIDAFNETNKTLIVIGDGTMLNALKKRASKNIVFVGFLDVEEINNVVGKAKAFVFAGKEDYGIAPLEAQACGTPVIAYGEAGVLETVNNGITGLFFKKQTKESLLEALIEFEEINFNYKNIRLHAENFSIEKFKCKFSTFVQDKIKTYYK